MNYGSVLKVGKTAVNQIEETEAAQARLLIATLKELEQLKPGEEAMLTIAEQTFVVTKATESDIERIGCGYICFD